MLCHLVGSAGQERFHALGPIYYRDANGALLVYDITDKESFTKVRVRSACCDGQQLPHAIFQPCSSHVTQVKNWVKELRKIVGDDIELCIAGNKCDLEKQRQVPEDEAEAYAVSVGATHYKVSAKNGRGVEDVFLQMSRTMVDKQSSKAGASAAGAAGRRKGRDVVTVVDEPSDEQAKSGGCC